LKSTSKNKSVASTKDYERFGRYMADVYESGYIDKARIYKMSFVKGVLTGFGGIIGATIVVALLLWVLSWFGQVPLIGDVVKNLEQTINN